MNNQTHRGSMTHEGLEVQLVVAVLGMLAAVFIWPDHHVVAVLVLIAFASPLVVGIKRFRAERGESSYGKRRRRDG